jgi:hypothetical protein
MRVPVMVAPGRSVSGVKRMCLLAGLTAEMVAVAVM